MLQRLERVQARGAVETAHRMKNACGQVFRAGRALSPLEIKRADLDIDPVARVIERLKKTGRLVLDGEPSAEQTSLF